MTFSGRAVLELSIALSISVAFFTNAKVIELGSSLSPSNTTSPPYWVSLSGNFAFGFHPQKDNNTLFHVAVWMRSRPRTTVVWTAPYGAGPYSSNATMKLTKEGLLLDGDGLGQIRPSKFINVLWGHFYYWRLPNISSAVMLDSGNFMLYNDGNSVLWQSFHFPTDTILGGQNLTVRDELVSGYRLRMQDDGNLVLYAANSSAIPENAYWVLSFSCAGYLRPMLCLNTSGFLYMVCDESSDEVFTIANGMASRSIEPGSEKGEPSFIYRATLDTDGIFRLYTHRFSSGNENSSGVEVWSAPQDHCDVKGLCGLNSYCTTGKGGRGTECVCYPGFGYVNPNDKNLGCYQTLAQESCESVRSDVKKGMYWIESRPSYNVSTIQHMSWGDNPYSHTQVINETSCSKSCLDDCNCWAALYNSNACKKYRLPLRYGKRNQNMTSIAFFKMVSKITEHIHRYPINPTELVVEAKNSLVLALSWIFGSVLCLFFFLTVVSFVVYKRKVYIYKRLLENANLGLAEDFSLQQFSYSELEGATNGFSEELGRGSFGAVYKGTTGKRAVAVKRLERVVEEGVREFRAEIMTIGQTHHRNLVQLVGFCVEGSKGLLVYEFMKNGSLSDLLFKATQRPAWKDRAKLALDVARGLFYLHEECGVHIIHCNLKPQNILLDDNWAAKISDFGFARLIVPNQSKLTSRDEETKGYFAPEWQKNALISVKSDIYSFGIVLFEIVCCRRNIDLKVSSPEERVLSSWVYNCYVSGELMKLVELDDHSNVDMKALERMVKVGLWCVQEDPSLRPTMKNAILMLEGIMDIPIPPYPELPLH